MFSVPPWFVLPFVEPDAVAHLFSESDLEGFLDEALPSEEMARIEKALRRTPRWCRRMAAINGRRDAGVHSVGAIWRRHRLSCPTREQLGNYLLGILPPEVADYVRFHLEMVGCRWCQANRSDLAHQQAATNVPLVPDLRSVPEAAVQSRRRKYFQSSAGYLRKGRGGWGGGRWLGPKMPRPSPLAPHPFPRNLPKPFPINRLRSETGTRPA